MPRPGPRLPGILSVRVLAAALGSAALFGGLAGCSMLEPEPSAATSSSPTPFVGVTPHAAWVEDLTFSGDFTGTLNQVSPGEAGMRTACTGPRGRDTGVWVLTLFGLVGSRTFGLQVTVGDYRGPGTYAAPQASMQVFRPDAVAGWRAAGGDQVAFTVAADEQSGTLDAHLTNLTDNRSQLRVRGRWDCVG